MIHLTCGYGLMFFGLFGLAPAVPAQDEEAGFVSLFDGVSLEHWVVGKGSQGHWRVADGIIDYDGESEGPRRVDQQLWTRKWYTDFTFRFEWRFPGPVREIEATTYLPTGGAATTADGAVKKQVIRSAGDSGVFLRGLGKLQINLGNLPLAGDPNLMGSGGVWGFFMDLTLPEATRAACRPLRNADKPPGEWNAMEITLQGNRVVVVSNGATVIDGAELPSLPYAGPIALQHHGLGPVVGAPPGKTSFPVPIQFRNLRIKEY